MSKLDQIKALGAAKAASRKSSDGGVESRNPARAEVLADLPVSDAMGNAGIGLAAKPASRSIVGVAPDPSDAKPKGLKITSRLKLKKSSGDGVALTSMAHPPGLIDQMAEAIKSGKLSLKRGRPKITEQRPWEAAGISRRTWYRQKESKT